MIRYIESEIIDRDKWDRCVSSSTADLVYGYSWYLDMVSPGWCGIVEDDYSSVMPLPVKNRLGFDYIIQPPYTQQLGIFSAKNSGRIRIMNFLRAIPSDYRYIDLNLNFSNDATGLPQLFKNNNNYELRLSKGAGLIKAGFSENTRRNIQKALNRVVIREDIKLDDHMFMVTNNRALWRNKDRLEWIKSFEEGMIRTHHGSIIGAYSGDELCASVFIITYRNRIYNLIPVSTSEGREKKAMFAIIDHLINKHAGSSVVLDFEGSNIEGVARFYKGFGAVPVNYPRVRINRLPFPVSLIRKK